MTEATSVALRIERHDGAYGFDDPAVPGDWTIEKLTEHAVPKLRYAARDAASGKPLRYSALHDGVELPRDARVGAAFPKRRGRLQVVHEYVNAR
jgi:hypothetical protein